MTPTAAAAPAITAADWFAAKLAYSITPYGLKSLLEKGGKDVFVLDVRAPEDFAKGHIPGATSIPLLDLAGKLGALPKDKTIVAYCGNMTCSLAPKAGLKLATEGFRVVELQGGFATWQEKGFPVQK
jgi:rhodanese-related sulfurtransferase